MDYCYDDELEFKAVVLYEKYYNEDTAWGCYNFVTEDNIPFYETRNTPFDDEPQKNKKYSSLSGKMQELHVGGMYLVKARYQFHKVYGHQYIPKYVYAIVPQNEDEQLLFLKSIINGTIAENLLKAYPNIVNDVINGKVKNIDYYKVYGVGEPTWQRIKDKILNNYLISDILIMLKPVGVTYTMIKKLLIDEPNPALLKKQLRENPYILTRIKGLGFKKIDAIAIKLKPKLLNSIERLAAFVTYYLKKTGENEGHTWVSKDTLKSAVNNYVPECINYLDNLLNNNVFLHIENNKIGLKYYYDTEIAIYKNISERISVKAEELFTDKQIETAIKAAEDEQHFLYTDEQKQVIYDSLKRNVSIISGAAGCVDCDTEFFTGTKWKRIADYKSGDKVLQYNIDGTANLTKPLAYIKQPKDYLWHFSTKYGLDQCLSEDHNCIIVSAKGKIKEESFASVMKRQNNNSFYDKFITAFDYEGKGIDLSDNMLRLMIAASADGIYDYSLKPKSPTYNRVSFRYKKVRKIVRLVNIIKSLKLDYTITNCANNDYVVIQTNLPYRIKNFPKEWYNCSKHQLKIIADEVMYWDGDIKKKNCYSTAIKENADFIQFVFSALGKRATIHTCDICRRIKNVNDKNYITKSVDYIVHITDKINVGMCCDNRNGYTSTRFERYKTTDSYEYCFTVPSHMLVLRRNNRIFITGNCGKTSIIRAIIKTYSQNNYILTASALSAVAAQRIEEATGFPASTIHRALGWAGDNHFLHNKDNPIITKAAFLDEGSMVNAPLFLKWLEAFDKNTRIIISGDNKQLPPIGYGNIFSDLTEHLDNDVLSSLTKPMRQAEESGILADANIIRNNKNPIVEELQSKHIHGKLRDMYYMFRSDRQALFNIAVNTFINTIPQVGLDNIVIAVPRKQGCLNCTYEFNKVIQDKLIDNDAPSINVFDTVIKLGAKVIQTVNDYDKNVFNGETGYVTEIGEKIFSQKTPEPYLIVDYTDLTDKSIKRIEYRKKDFTSLDLAYALSVHRCQGIGKHTVIGVIDNTHYQLLDSCMLYTLVTRAKNRCLLLAEPDAFLRCIRTSHNRRNTWLSSYYNY